MLTKEDLKHYKGELDKLRSELVREIQYIKNEVKEADENGSNTVRTHLAETADVITIKDTLYSKMDNSYKLLEAVENAISRMENGVYGLCMKCGKQISKERLNAVPYATLCIDCKKANEKRY